MNPLQRAFPLVSAIWLSGFPLPANFATAAVDQTPPAYTRLVVIPNVIDVTGAVGEVEVEMHIVDDVTGLSSGGILIDFEDILLKWGFNNESLEEGLPTDGIYRVPVTIPQGAPPGEWSFGAQLFDGANRVSQKYLDSPALTVINNGQIDAEPPTLHDIRFKDEVLDISDGGGVVEFEIDVSDDVSGIFQLRFDLVPEIEDISVDSRLFVYYNLTDGSERKTVKANYQLGPYAPSGTWKIDLLALEDKVRRTSPYEFNPSLFEADFSTKIDIINSNSDLEKPELTGFAFGNTSPDISFADARIPFSLDFKEVGSGIKSLLIKLHPPSGGKELTYYRKNPEFSSGDSNGGTVEDYFEIPRFSEFGTYQLAIRLDDLAGNFIRFGYGTGNPLPEGISPTINVTNTGGVDQTDVIIDRFYYSPAPVDVSDGYQFVDLFVDFTDDVSGLDTIDFDIDSPDEEFSLSARFEIDDLVEGDAFGGTVKTKVQIPRFSEPGQWKITGLSTGDNAGNYQTIWSYPVFKDDSPNFIQVVNNGLIDRDGPELVDFTIESEVIDITDSEKRIDAWLTASDSVSGVDNVWLTFASPAQNHSYLFLSANDFDIEQSSGDSVTFADDILVRQFIAPGDYILDSIEIEDKLGRETVYEMGTENPIPPGVPGKITVVNNGPVDEENPEISDIRVSRTSFDVTDFTQYAEVEIDAADDVSGAYWLEIRIAPVEQSGYFRIYDSRDFQLVSGSRRSGTLRATLTIPRFIPPGTYTVSYGLDDEVHRSALMRGSDSDFPFPDVGTFEIANSGPVDTLDPGVRALSIEELIDTSDGDATAQVTLEIVDDVSGVEFVTLSAISPSGVERVSRRLESGDLETGTLTDGTFLFPLEFPAFSEAGTWRLDILMRDNVGNWYRLESEEMAMLGLPESISVINDRPAGYLWKGSDIYADGWRYLEWFGWTQDPGSYPYVHHTEHGWVYTSGSNLAAFSMYDFGTGFWWSVNEEWYPYMYANSSPPRWVYYYAPYGTPGNRWFHDYADGRDKQESEL